MFLPLLFKDGFACLIVGGGQVATRKVEVLLQIPCSLTVVAPVVSGDIAEAAKRRDLDWQERKFSAGDCQGFDLVIAATPSRDVNREVFLEARRLRVPVNVVDDPELSTVIFPAVRRSGPLVLAVSTEGVAPFMAAAIRDRLAAEAESLGKWVEIGGRFRQVVRSEITDGDGKTLLLKRFLAAAQPGHFADPPESSRLSDWLAWLSEIEQRRK